MATPATVAVLDALATADGPRFVGGCVRDALLTRPVTDIDIATPLMPAEVSRRLEQAGLRAVPTGVSHGTVTAVASGASFEITTLRRDVRTDGRHAQVAFTSDWQEDAARRDFTMNAMFCDTTGRLWDWFDGATDARLGRVRFVGEPEQRIREDVLRIMRFFRFHARYGCGAPEPEALAACAALAPLCRTLSGERIRQEVFKLVLADRAAETWAFMMARGIVAHVLDQARRCDVLQRLISLETTLQALHISPPVGPLLRPTPIRRLAALLDGNAETAWGVAERLRLSKAERTRLVALGQQESPPLTPGALRRALVQWDDIGATIDHILVGVAATRPDWTPGAMTPLLAVLEAWPNIQFPLTGSDLQDLGMPPGPELGRVLTDLRLWWADAGFPDDRQAALAAARCRLGPDPTDRGDA